MKTFLKITRVRFWIYLAGPFLLGTTFSSPMNIYSNFFFYGLFVFLIPANILLYLTNDYFDQTTDQLNPKKKEKESVLKDENKFFYLIAIVTSALLFIPLILSSNFKTQILIYLFLFLAIFYSAPPFRFKSKPLLDFSSNFLYVIPALISYSFFTTQLPSLQLVFAGFLWASAMHLYSAIPDIKSDKKAKIKTTAVWLGYKKSLICCAFFWLVTILLLLPFNMFFSLGLIYPLIPILVLLKKIDLVKIYWQFPFLNAGLGFILFLYSLNLTY